MDEERQRDPVSETARWMAAARALEAERADRLFDDPLARALAGPAGFAVLRRLQGERDNPYPIVRTRWFDEFLASTSHRQVVLLGAGLDARAFRLDWPAGTVLYEVDRAELLAAKQVVLEAERARPRCDRRPVGADLAGDWATPLIEAGYDPKAPSVWAIEGVLFYLPEELAQSVLSAAARLAAPGSRLAGDLIGTGFFRVPGFQDLMRSLREAGSPWIFGTDEPERFLAGSGWQPDEIIEPGDEQANYATRTHRHQRTCQTSPAATSSPRSCSYTPITAEGPGAHNAGIFRASPNRRRSAAALAARASSSPTPAIATAILV